MELRQLRYFLKAGELLNFTLAARAVNISQSTLSQQIKQLEDELGMPLFDRIGKRIVLTEAGKYFQRYAKSTVKSAEDGLQVLKDLSGIKTGELHIGVTYTLGRLLTPTLLAFSNAYPQVKIKVTFATSDELVALLSSAALDFILSFQDHMPDEPFVSEPLFSAEMALVVAEQDPIGARKTVSLREAASRRLALPVSGYSTRRFLDESLLAQQLSPDIQVELNDIPTLLDLVKTGDFSTILSRTTVEGVSGLKTVPISGKDMMRQAWLVRLGTSYEKQAAKVFAGMLLGGASPARHW